MQYNTLKFQIQAAIQPAEWYSYSIDLCYTTSTRIFYAGKLAWVHKLSETG